MFVVIFYSVPKKLHPFLLQ